MSGILGLTSISLWPALIGAGGIAIAAGGGVHYADSQIYGNEIAGLKLQAAQSTSASYKASLDTFVADAKLISDAATKFQVQQVNLQSQFTSIKAAFDVATRTHALPADCKPDDNRLRALSAAIAAANAAANTAPGPNSSKQVPGPARPSHP